MAQGTSSRIIMKLVIFICILAVASARPEDFQGYAAPSAPKVRFEEHHIEEPREFFKILRDDRVDNTGDGSYHYAIETENGIKMEETGERLDDVEHSPVGQQGSYSFELPNGETFHLKYVADENGFHPESDHLPKAPEFPHDLPQFVLDQIAKAELEREEEERAAKLAVVRSDIPLPGRSYSSP